MDFLSLTKTRRSVRSYSSDKVDRSSIEQCIETARLSPSACNSQPWSFVIIDDTEYLQKLAKLTTLPPSNINRFVKTSPAVVALVTERPNISASVGAAVKNKPYWLMDIGIAAEHFCLQAAEIGLGTCMLGWFDEKKVKKLLNIPKGKNLPLLITIGYPTNKQTEAKQPPYKKRKPLQDIVHYNGYTQ